MAGNRRLIDANVVLAKQFTAGLSDASGNYYGHADVVFVNDIENAPTVDAVEVAHGEWSTIEDDYCGMTALQCSKCNQEYWFEDEPPTKIYKYCPNCGAKMDGGA